MENQSNSLLLEEYEVAKHSMSVSAVMIMLYCAEPCSLSKSNTFLKYVGTEKAVVRS